MPKPLAVVVGLGPGNGLSFARRFAAEGYNVAMMTRSRDRLSEYEGLVDNARGFVCDVTDPAAVEDAFAQMRAAMGPASVLIYNAGAGHWQNVEETSAADLESSWRTNALGCMTSAQQVIPDMRAAGAGSIVVIGAGAALRGRAGTTAFASAKAAQRSIAQSMARHLGPAGIHVSYVVIDGVIDLPRTRQAMPDKEKGFFLAPDHIADAVYGLVTQPRSAWTFEIDLRPFGENW